MKKRTIKLVFITESGKELSPVEFDVFDGLKGDEGPPGPSNYEVWLKEPGNKGKSFNQFLETLKPTILVKHQSGDSKEAVISQYGVSKLLKEKVDVSLTINNKPLTGNINLSAKDVGTLSSDEINKLIETLNGRIDKLNTDYTNLVEEFGKYRLDVAKNYVPISRKINGQSLQTDIKL